ncbi:hypothetical protein HOC80_05175 [archaeon]|jgi:hypothetical protein|nr:hypothetical protein [archaeon]MBT4417464.1 hypothetical protein [archaeon]
MQEIRDLHEQYWETVKQVLPNDLDLPYLQISTVAEAYADFHKSITGEDVKFDSIEPEVPTSMSLLDSGALYDFVINRGGILIPTACLDDEVEVTKCGLVHEQVHEVLSGQALVYASDQIFKQYGEAGNMLIQFVEHVAHGYALKILEREGISAEQYLRAPVEFYNPRSRAFFGITEHPLTPDAEVEHMVEQYGDYMKEIADLDPINRFTNCLENFLEMFVKERATRDNARKVVISLMNSNPLVKRRVDDGGWKVVKPLQFPDR